MKTKQLIGTIAGWTAVLAICGGGLTYCSSCVSKRFGKAQERFENIRPSLETIEFLGVEGRVLSDLNDLDFKYIDFPPYRSLDLVVENVNGEKHSRGQFSYRPMDGPTFHLIRKKAVEEGLVGNGDIYAD